MIGQRHERVTPLPSHGPERASARTGGREGATRDRDRHARPMVGGVRP